MTRLADLPEKHGIDLFAQAHKHFQSQRFLDILPHTLLALVKESNGQLGILRLKNAVLAHKEGLLGLGPNFANGKTSPSTRVPNVSLSKTMWSRHILRVCGRNG